ncbi:Fic family protein [Treponema bryantii]|uniref:Fic family protein n=1 Tax=Treponema bryantii TaxID=163 RepID=A0A1H9GI59_9SPIR|nr:Fic family protein [Treponema bryantii]SEQ49739.1 Fic family protein [Treponema bryantii]
MIEECPKVSGLPLLELILNKDYSFEISKMNDEYYYWDKVKYNTPKGIKKEEFWALVKYSRTANSKIYSFNTCTFSLFLTNKMQEYLHNFDMNFGGTIASSDILLDKNKQYYLLSSIMEEAIASSQMEGASTTRKVAKEMLRKQAKPKDKSQQMILNNYNTIRYLSEHKNDNLTPELLLTIHKQITEKTLDNPKDEGQFRTDNNIYVVNGITGEVAHDPPSYKQIKKVVQQLCKFINEDKEFIHPIIKAIILHFMISYLHPFVDGNGRTARSLFYWYMLKKGYWLTEYLSISRIIYKSKGQYEKAFLYTEHDDFDLGYFVNYNLKVLNEAFYELQVYLNRKAQENEALLEYRIPGLNDRQIQIITLCIKKPSSIFISKDLETRFNVSVKTIRSDLEGLVELGLLTTVPLNKRLTGYTRAENFEERLGEIRGN